MKRNVIIPQSLLKRFIKRKKLTGTVALLHFLRSKENLKNFYLFCETLGYKVNLPQQPSSIIFHGSQSAQSVLVPKKSVGAHGTFEKKAFVYATDDPNYAIFLAILSLKNGGAGVIMKKSGAMLSVDLDFVNGPSKIKNGYVHVVENKSFKKMKNREYKTDKRAKVLVSLQVRPHDLTVPIYIQART